MERRNRAPRGKCPAPAAGTNHLERAPGSGNAIPPRARVVTFALADAL